QTLSTYGGLPDPAQAFEIHPDGGTGTQYARTLDTDVTNNLFQPSAPNTIDQPDDPYVRLYLDGFADYAFGPLSKIELDYDYTQAYITDLAGNLLIGPGRMRIIDRD